MVDWGGSIIQGVYKILTQEDLIDTLESYFKEEIKILLLGTTGVGKTLFIDSLTKNIIEPISSDERTIRLKKTKGRIKSNRYVFIDTPGQYLKFTWKSKELKDLISDVKLGIINVVSYGYHEYNLTKSEISEKVILNNDENRINEQYLENHRKYECKRLSEWKNLFHIMNPRWFITVITKADLWWNNKKKCLEHYKTGKYGNFFKDFKDSRHIYLPYCSIINKFYGIQINSDFVETNKHTLQSNFMKSFRELLM